ncbi:Anaphase spindle elongation protein 1 [Psilocybe cubensis]|uniref:Microtubule associated protein n=2 Tax=Psilocybe cubensis TaxID=181762 RepID=A0A8H7XWY0_PSICU|nr:Anaphase spindle elongation protein 1 [Psilocybe cubensis]KAH9475907.1 Anaphase spindle elongation protein 1 [Psilocybe cubensis]
MSTPSTATTLTSLLNSLHSHLLSQTQLLPTLHAQLGLPESALEDELRALQQQLVDGVELRIDRRRKEVDEWMAKCDGLENECIRYTKALGGNIKATGSSLGELRKEQALPRRFELISEYQEKLRQLYHTKVEQLNTLTNRLNALSRTLGPDYFAQDIIEPTVAAGESAYDAGANRDVTPERFMKLEKELVRGKAEVLKRLNQLSATFVQIDWLYTELGIVPPATDELEASPAQTTSTFTQSLASSSSTKVSSSDPFLTSTPTPMSRSTSTNILFREDVGSVPEYEYQRIFSNFVARIEEAEAENLPQSQSVPVGLDGVDPTPGLLSWAATLHASLEEIKRRREAHIQTMYDQLEGLWRRLGVSEEDMDNFVEAHRGSTEETVQEYEDELERMLELKRERMGTFVASAREEIVRLWDDLMIGEEERADFPPFADDEYTEQLLTLHEDEIKRLKEERRNKAPLLAAIKKYFEICEEEKELANAASDQTRLTGRGPRDPGRLLREEKMRKRVQKEKPRLEQDLLVSIPAWEEDAGRPFLVHGESFLQLLMESVSAADQENKRKPSSRAGSVPARATTPTGSSGYVPGTKTGVVTPAVRTREQAGNGSQSVPSKRQRVGEHAASTPVYGVRAPLGTHRGVNTSNSNSNSNGHLRSSSPTKIPSKSLSGGVGSGLPRPAGLTLGMVQPKPGTAQHALGHGRVPTSVIYGASAYAPGSMGVRSASVMGYGSGGRTASGGAAAGGYGKAGSVAGAGGIAKKSTRARRESFKPRPSVDVVDIPVAVGHGTKRWGGGYTVNEDEEY